MENTFYTDPYNVQTLLTVGPPTINSNGVVIYPSIGGTVSSLEIGTTGVLAIYGTYLTGGGQDLSPVVRVSNGVTITGYQYVSDGQINASYSATSATPGTASVTVSTNVGTSAPAQIEVGDLSPVITSISQNSFFANVSQSVIISGQHFGTTNCPALTFPFSVQPGSYSSSSCSDSSMTANFIPSGVGTGTLTLTAAGYGGEGFDPQSPQQSNKANSPPVTSTIQLAVLGNEFIFVGADPQVLIANTFTADSPTRGGTLTAVSSDAKDKFTGVAGPPSGVRVATPDQSTTAGDRKLTFTYTVPGVGSTLLSMSVTARQFAWLANNSPSNVCTLPFGTNKTYTYTVYTHPGTEQAVDSDSGLNGTVVTETFSTPLGCGLITGDGTIDANGQFADHISSICSGSALTCSITTTQTLSVGGFSVRTNG